MNNVLPDSRDPKNIKLAAISLISLINEVYN